MVTRVAGEEVVVAVDMAVVTETAMGTMVPPLYHPEGKRGLIPRRSGQSPPVYE